MLLRSACCALFTLERRGKSSQQQRLQRPQRQLPPQQHRPACLSAVPAAGCRSRTTFFRFRPGTLAFSLQFSDTLRPSLIGTLSRLEEKSVALRSFIQSYQPLSLLSRIAPLRFPRKVHCQEVQTIDFPAERRKKKRRRFLGVRWLAAFFHVIQLCCLLVPGVILLLWSLATRRSRLLGPLADKLLWRYLYIAVPAAGPCYIKFCQWGATRADIFDPESRAKLARFHNAVTAHSFADTMLRVSRALPVNLVRRLYVAETPVGAGCVAQVHRALLQLSPDDDEILREIAVSKDFVERSEKPLFLSLALKVLHPGVAWRMRLDLVLMEAAAKAASLFPGLQFLALAEAATQFRDLMEPQLDFRQEAAHMKRFATNFKKPTSMKRLARYRCSIAVPTVLQSLCSSKLLCQSYEEGLTIGTWMRATAGRSSLGDEDDGEAWNAKSHFLTYLDQPTTADRERLRAALQSLDGLDGLDGPSVSRNRSRPRRCLQRFKPLTLTLQKVTRQVSDYVFYRLWRTSRLAWEKATGKRFSDVQEDYAGRAYWSLVGTAGLATFLQMVFVDNFVHADLHPGNLLIRFRDPTTPAPILPHKRNGLFSLFSEAGDSRIANLLRPSRKRLDEGGETAAAALPAFSGLVSDAEVREQVAAMANEGVRRHRGRLSGAIFGRSPPRGLLPANSSTLNSSEDKDGESSPPPHFPASAAPQFRPLIKRLFSSKVPHNVDFQLVLLDSGLCAALSARDFVNLCHLFRCVCMGDGWGAGKQQICPWHSLLSGRLMVERARFHRCADIEAFCKDVEALVQLFYAKSRGSLRLQETRLGEILARTLSIACVHRVELDPHFVSLMLAVVVLEGVGRQLDGEIDLLAAVVPYVGDVMLKNTVAGLRGVM